MEDGGERNLYQHHHYHHHHHNRFDQNTQSSSPDDISVFLHQLLLRSSSSSSMAGNDRSSLSPANLRRLSAGDGFLSSVSGVCGNVDETDHEYEESEEGLEALVEEGHIKHSNQRNSSKRTRAAEVHNQSEKRRRSRINEKMKALQNLIPNSNKTDKASMLDEAIEYLKQLQLQVQMLSMRNGLSLHPMSLPDALQLSHSRMGAGEENHPYFHMSLLLGQENVLRLPSHPSLPVMSDIINPGPSFGLESQFGSFQVQAAAEEICREDIVSHRLGNVHCYDPNSSA